MESGESGGLVNRELKKSSSLAELMSTTRGESTAGGDGGGGGRRGFEVRDAVTTSRRGGAGAAGGGTSPSRVNVASRAVSSSPPQLSTSSTTGSVAARRLRGEEDHVGAVSSSTLEVRSRVTDHASVAAVSDRSRVADGSASLERFGVDVKVSGWWRSSGTGGFSAAEGFLEGAGTPSVVVVVAL